MHPYLCQARGIKMSVLSVFEVFSFYRRLQPRHSFKRSRGKSDLKGNFYFYSVTPSQNGPVELTPFPDNYQTVTYSLNRVCCEYIFT